MQITDANSVRVQIYNQAGQFVYETSTPVASSTCSSATPPNLIFCSGFEAQQGGAAPSSTRHIHLAGKQIARTSITSGNPNSTTTFVHTDLLGSVVAESTQAPPQITLRPLHEPFGAPSTGTYLQGPYHTGHVTDSTSGLSYMQARYYDPLAGRFLGVDPVGADLASGGNFNRYWHGNNNPYRFVDPDGRQALPTTGVPFFDWFVTPSDARASTGEMMQEQLTAEVSRPISMTEKVEMVAVSTSLGTGGATRIAREGMQFDGDQKGPVCP